MAPVRFELSSGVLAATAGALSTAFGSVGAQLIVGAFLTALVVLTLGVSPRRATELAGRALRWLARWTWKGFQAAGAVASEADFTNIQRIAANGRETIRLAMNKAHREGGVQDVRDMITAAYRWANAISDFRGSA